MPLMTAVLVGTVYAGNSLMTFQHMDKPPAPGQTITDPTAAHALPPNDSVISVDGDRVMVSGAALQDIPAGTTMSFGKMPVALSPFASLAARRMGVISAPPNPNPR